MDSKIYVIWDTKADMPGSALMLLRNDDVAIRNFVDTINTPDSYIRKHPEDFDLRVLGYFNNGQIEGLLDPQAVITAKQVLAFQNEHES